MQNRASPPASNRTSSEVKRWTLENRKYTSTVASRGGARYAGLVNAAGGPALMMMSRMTPPPRLTSEARSNEPMMSNCFRAASRDPETAKKKTPARSSQTRTMLKEKVTKRPGR